MKARNPLRDAVADLRFLVEFAQLETAALAPMARRERVRRLGQISYRYQPMGSMWTLPAHSDEKIPESTWTGVLSDKDSSLTQKIQVRLLAFLKDMAKQDVRRVRVMLPAAAQISAPLFHVTLRGVNFDHIVRLLATPFRTSDRVLYATYLLVEEVGRHRLCTCPARGCERLFVKVTQKQFCSTRCQSREYMREYRVKNFTAQKRVAKRGVSDGKQTRAGRR